MNFDTLAKDEKAMYFSSFMKRREYEKAAALLETESAITDSSENKLFSDEIIYNHLANIHAYKTLNFRKAFQYNSKYLEIIEYNKKQKRLGQSAYLLKKKNFDLRQIYLLEITYDQEGLSHYVDTGIYREYLLRKTGTLPDGNPVKGSPLNDLFQESKDLLERHAYEEALSRYETLMDELRVVRKDAHFKRLQQLYNANKKINLLDLKNDLKSNDFLAVLPSVFFPPLYLLLTTYAVTDTIEYSSFLTEQQHQYYRDKTLYFESSKGQLLNYVISPVQQIDYLYNIAQAYEKTEQNSPAISHYQEAITILENLRSTIDTDRQKITFFTEKLNVYGRLIGLLIKEDRIEEAFFMVDRCKARSLTDLIATKVLLGSEHVDVDEIKIKSSKIRALMDQVMISDSQVRGLEVKSKQDDKSDTPLLQLSSLITPEPLTLNLLAGALSERMTVVELYYEDGYFLTVCFNKAQGFFYQVSKIELNGFDRLLQAQIDSCLTRTFNKKQFSANSRILYRLIFGEISDKLSSELLIIPYGNLYNFPFSTLQAGSGYIVEDHAISILPSASLLRFLENEPENKPTAYLVGGIAYGNYTKLDYTGEEVAAIGRIISNTYTVTGGDAIKENFISTSPDYGVIHFAGHAYFDARDPLNSGLVFSDMEQDHLLTGYDLLQINLHCDLLTLSACETGVNMIWKQAEMFGLKRAFFFSGVHSILSSLWQVDDSTTKQTMETFYTNLLHTSASDALRQAQLRVMSEKPQPFYWASFQLSGTGQMSLAN